jgi:hypothetical protein
MLKEPELLNETVENAAEALKGLLAEVPPIKLKKFEIKPPSSENGNDFLVHLHVHDHLLILVCEVKTNGQPRNVRSGLYQIQNYARKLGKKALPVFIAPYLSPESQALCRESGAGYLDLYGNARIVFDGLFIERVVSGKPRAERRDLKSLFRPKSARVLRILLREPDRPWRVAELAEEANVSVGHVSNVRSGLIAREWAQVSKDGLFLSDPGALLEEWRAEYEPPAGKRVGYYTTLHGLAFDDAIRNALHAEHAILASFSAARWLAPYGRTGSQYFYADQKGLEALKAHLNLSMATKGENVIVTLPKDKGLFIDAQSPAPGIICTSTIQTYLDLTAAGERGQEAAEYLRQEQFRWRR